MPLVNDFLIGADPELGVIEGGHLARYTARVPAFSPWGIDHGGYVLEAHPKPAKSVHELVENLKVAMNDLAISAPQGAWKAGAYLEAPERHLTLGGHVHIDLPRETDEQTCALDLLTMHLEQLDILPAASCVMRRNQGNAHEYGQFGDIRREHGHFEYRTMPSWLFSQRVAKICLTGAKLAIVQPKVIIEMGSRATASISKLRTMFENFKGKDDDVDRMLDSRLFYKKLSIDPTRDVRDVWKVSPVPENPHWKQAGHAEVLPADADICPIFVRGTFNFFYTPGRFSLPDLVATNEYANSRDLVPGQRYAGYLFVGRRGEPWPDAIPHASLRVGVNNERYTFWVLPSHLTNETGARAAIRAWLTTHRILDVIPGQLSCCSGFVFALANREEARVRPEYMEPRYDDYGDNYN